MQDLLQVSPSWEFSSDFHSCRDGPIILVWRIGTLSYTLSLVFFGWFVAVFIMLSARALPSRGNLAENLMYVAADAAKKLRGVFSLPNFDNLPNRKKYN